MPLQRSPHAYFGGPGSYGAYGGGGGGGGGFAYGYGGYPPQVAPAAAGPDCLIPPPPGDGGGNDSAAASTASFPVIVSDDIVSGTKRNGWMSPVRRFFCLLVTFDFLFVSLLWVITVIVTGRDVKKAFEQQVLQYTIHDSMFDCVVSTKAMDSCRLAYFVKLIFILCT